MSVIRGDSAGIEIVENPAGRTVGAIELGPLFADTNGHSGFEIGLVAPAPGDGFVLASTSRGEVIVVGPSGVPVLRFGRIGSGPGEFRQLRAVEPTPDGALVAIDPGNSRVTWFAMSGQILREETVAGVAPVGVFADGALLLRGIDADSALSQPGVHRPPHTLRVRLANGTGEAVVARILGDEAMYERHPQMGLIYGPVPFGRATYVVAAADGFTVATNIDYQLDRYDRTGKIVQIVRRDAPVRPITDEMVTEYLSALPGGDTEAGRRRLREYMPDLGTSGDLPFIDALRASAAGTAWVRSAPPPGARLAEWAVFDTTGALVAVGHLPVGFKATTATDLTMLGVIHDAEGDAMPMVARAKAPPLLGAPSGNNP